MKTWEIKGSNDEWPDLSQFVGAEVMSADLRQSDTALILAFQSKRQMAVSPPWQYSSCLLAVSSAELDSENNDPENTSLLVGLCGAKFTAVESDENHLDLILGSIRISVTKVTQTNP